METATLSPPAPGVLPPELDLSQYDVKAAEVFDAARKNGAWLMLTFFPANGQLHMKRVQKNFPDDADADVLRMVTKEFAAARQPPPEGPPRPA